MKLRINSLSNFHKQCSFNRRQEDTNVSYGTKKDMRLKGIHRNFPFALQSRVQFSHSIKMLPLTEVKGNLKI